MPIKTKESLNVKVVEVKYIEVICRGGTTCFKTNVDRFLKVFLVKYLKESQDFRILAFREFDSKLY